MPHHPWLLGCLIPLFGCHGCRHLRAIPLGKPCLPSGRPRLTPSSRWHCRAPHHPLPPGSPCLPSRWLQVPSSSHQLSQRVPQHSCHQGCFTCLLDSHRCCHFLVSSLRVNPVFITAGNALPPVLGGHSGTGRKLLKVAELRKSNFTGPQPQFRNFF